jgi:hypothetical protein
MHHVLDRIGEINEIYYNNNLSSISSLRDLKQQVENLENISRFLISKAYVRMAKDRSEHLVKAAQSNKMIVDTEGPNKKEKIKLKYHGWLYDEMQSDREILSKENFEMLGDKVKISYDEYQEAIQKNNYNNYSNLIQIPPNTELLNPKPIIYDLTFQRFQYPELENKMKKAQSGILGRAFGYFFNKK